MKLLCALSLFVLISFCAAGDADKCVEGHTYEESCNTCHCTSTGVYACTLRDCYDGPQFPDTKPEKKIPLNEPGYRCTPGAVFKEECNTCTCDTSGALARCTAMACDPNEKYRKRRQATETCTDGDQKKQDCNGCHCIKGIWACTRMACPPEPLKL